MQATGAFGLPTGQMPTSVGSSLVDTSAISPKSGVMQFLEAFNPTAEEAEKQKFQPIEFAAMNQAPINVGQGIQPSAIDFMAFLRNSRGGI
jgi:hypothetical protein